MKNAVIIDSVRTAVGRMGGTLKDVEVDYLAANLAEMYSISRTEQDEFALRSQENAERAITSGLFIDQIVPFEVKTKKFHFIRRS